MTTPMREAIQNSPRAALLLFSHCCANAYDASTAKKKTTDPTVCNNPESIDFCFKFRNDFVVATQKENIG